jgi:gas vesicle protein
LFSAVTKLRRRKGKIINYKHMARSGSKILLAGLLGLAAGVAVGVLFAPAKGAKTRKRLTKKIMNFADNMQDDLSDKLNAIKSVFSIEEPEEESADEKVKKDEEEEQ